MDFIKFLLDALGWRWCIPKGERETEKLLEDFLAKKIPVFWVMGPAYCGKTSTSEKIAKLTEYNLIKVSQLIRKKLDEKGYESEITKEYIKACGLAPDEIVVPLIKQEILTSYENSNGFIIDGFPVDVRQAKFFIENICKPNIIIFVCLLQDELLVRISDIENIDKEKIVKNYGKSMKNMNEIYRRYERKTLKLLTNVPPDKIARNLLIYLNEHYGYNF